MPLNVSDAYSAQFSQFVKFAEDQTNAATSKTIARLSPSDGSLATRTISATGDDKVYAIRRSSTAKAENNAVRDAFKKSVADMFGGESRIPESVLKAMEMKDFEKGKPLTTRRIMAVKVAIDAYLSYGELDFFAKQMNVDHATRLGYAPAELPKINRAINLFMAANPGFDVNQAALEVMTPGRPANRLMGYGGRFMEDAKTFDQGLKLIGDFAKWHGELYAQVSSGNSKNKTSLTAFNLLGSVGTAPEQVEHIFFNELAVNRSINLSGTPEEVFGMKNNPATRFFFRGFTDSNTFTFLQMPQEKRSLFYHCADLLMPIQRTPNDTNGGADGSSFLTSRLLRHFDELETLQAKGQLTLKSLWNTCFPDYQPMPKSHHHIAIKELLDNFSVQAMDYLKENASDPGSANRYTSIIIYTNQQGLTFNDAKGFVERGEIPPSPSLVVPFSCSLESALNTEHGRAQLSEDLRRPGNYERSDAPQAGKLLQDSHFTINIPGEEPLKFTFTNDANDREHCRKMDSLYDRMKTMCGETHPRQLNMVLFSMGQGPLSRLKAGFPAQKIISNEHSPVIFSLSRDMNSGDVTIRCDSPHGCPVTFSWTTTISPDGQSTTTPMQVIDQPTP